MIKNPEFGSQKISSFVIKKPQLLSDLTYSNKVKFTRKVKSCSKNRIEKQDGRFVVMAARNLQTLNIKFDQVMFNFFWGEGVKMRDKMAISAYIFEMSRKGPIFRVSN